MKTFNGIAHSGYVWPETSISRDKLVIGVIGYECIKGKEFKHEAIKGTDPDGATCSWIAGRRNLCI
jgi:hypothetical protein